MAGFMGTTLTAELLDFVYRGQAITIGADLYLRLLTAPSNPSGGGTESAYGGYARLALSRDTTWFAATSNKRIVNQVALVFPVPTSLDDDFVAFDIVDTPSGAFTKLYHGGPISPAKAVQIGKAPTFDPGALEVTN